MASKELEDKLSQNEARSFAYNHDTGLFCVGNREISVGAAAQDIKRLHSSEDDTILDNPVLMTTAIGRIVSGPKLFDWVSAEGNYTNDFCRDVASVMRDVYVELEPNSESYLPDDSVNMFSIEKLRSWGVVLNTLGNCACLGPEASSTFIPSRFWGEKYAHYTLHNADYAAQKISLHAGLGYVAGLVETSAQ